MPADRKWHRSTIWFVDTRIVDAVAESSHCCFVPVVIRGAESVVSAMSFIMHADAGSSVSIQMHSASLIEVDPDILRISGNSSAAAEMAISGLVINGMAKPLLSF